MADKKDLEGKVGDILDDIQCLGVSCDEDGDHHEIGGQEEAKETILKLIEAETSTLKSRIEELESGLEGIEKRLKQGSWTEEKVWINSLREEVIDLAQETLTHHL